MLLNCRDRRHDQSGPAHTHSFQGLSHERTQSVVLAASSSVIVRHSFQCPENPRDEVFSHAVVK